jgi:hypothetical protein
MKPAPHALTPGAAAPAEILVADSPLRPAAGRPEGCCVEVDGEPFYRISNYDSMPPFFMSLASDSDHWLFISSNGALTAGRRDPDHALFPYYTDDRIHDSRDLTGAKTILRVTAGGETRLWEPFSDAYAGMYRVSRTLFKSAYGNRIIFEERNSDLSVLFSYAWMTSERFGFVRRVRMRNLGRRPVEVAILDGIQNVMPSGLTRRFQNRYSTLADGYRENEREPGTFLGLYKLSSIPTDRPEPSEALRVTTVWSEGLDTAAILLSASQLQRFRLGVPVEEESLVRGRRGAYFLDARISLAPDQERQWLIAADVGRDASDVRAILTQLSGGLASEVMADVARGTENLVRVVASADGLQRTEDSLSAWRHFSNTLFNVLRGGIPDDGYTISRADLASFMEKAHRPLAAAHAAFLESLLEWIPHGELLSLSRGRGDPDLERIVHEYLPLTFSRRHGDPSRPWNAFSINVKDEHGRKVLAYQGNWRDIFQNWEALALSFPGYIECMVFKFLDASTADGYNPYRVTREGFEWEVSDPDDPWSSIGYWGDHQVIYLLKLLEESRRYHPLALEDLLGRAVFTYANVPYRIKPYEDLLRDPRSTIEFDAALNVEIARRAAAEGTEGKHVRDADGALHRVTMAEKLLVLSLSKLSNYVPEAGIWMNTQRPEWNDANNALVGYGVSVVTLCYLRRFLSFCKSLFDSRGGGALEISVEVVGMLGRVESVMRESAPLLPGPVSDRDRRAILDRLGEAGSLYRREIYERGFSGRKEPVAASELSAFCDAAVGHIDSSIRANARSDGLYHAYNIMNVAGASGISIRRLPEMLEGQVAVLSSGILSAREAVSLLDALRASSLYRSDQDSYLLYPDRRLPRFLEKNNIPPGDVDASRLLSEMLARGDRRIVVADIQGRVHFNASFRNAEVLRGALAALKRGEYREGVEKEETALLELYERLFDHQSFTGRSGAFFKYEGLGCVYWHMVSKLLLAVQEVLLWGVRAGENAAVVEALKRHYRSIREGIGVHKSPELYGAVPTDPYSHTPGFAGAQQPGMTGQVKEDIITRLGEMGVVVEEGCISFYPGIVTGAEFLSDPGTFAFYDPEGRKRSVELGIGTLAFTICQVPVVEHRRGPARIEITRMDGVRTSVQGLVLDLQTSSAIFRRTGDVGRLDVFFDLS